MTDIKFIRYPRKPLVEHNSQPWNALLKAGINDSDYVMPWGEAIVIVEAFRESTSAARDYLFYLRRLGLIEFCHAPNEVAERDSYQEPVETQFKAVSEMDLLREELARAHELIGKLTLERMK